MITPGHVTNGVVVPAEGVCLPEGLEVAIVAPSPSPSLVKGPGPHSVLDIPPISVGAVLYPLTSDDDLLGEMLEGRS
jgi:hypothetical protein